MMEEGSKSGEVSGDSLIINEDIKEDEEEEDSEREEERTITPYVVAERTNSDAKEGPPTISVPMTSIPNAEGDPEWEKETLHISEEEEIEDQEAVKAFNDRTPLIVTPPTIPATSLILTPTPLATQQLIPAPSLEEEQVTRMLEGNNTRKMTTLNVPSVTVSAHPLPPPPNIPTLPPGTIAKPVVDPPTEVPSVDGHDPAVRKLIIMAIDVMKNRKARPDGKRISNWINRRYGRTVVSINEELEKMVIAGELTRVDYKGSASYRITTAEAKSARRRRRLQKNNIQNNHHGNTTNSTPSTVRESGSLIVEPILRQPNISSAHKLSQQHQIQPISQPQVLSNTLSQPQISIPQHLQQHPSLQQHVHSPQIQLTHSQIPTSIPQKIPTMHHHHHPPPFAPTAHTYVHPPPAMPGTPIHPHYHHPPTKFMLPQEITLRTLVCDYMGDLSSSGIPIGDEIDIKFIGRSVNASRRPINSRAVLANLENILEKEIQAGHFIKIGDDLYVMQPSIVGGYHQIPTSSPMAGQQFIISPASMTNTIINPAPMPPPPSAGPPPFLSTSSAPPPPQIVNIGISGPNLSEYMYNHGHANSQIATPIPLTVTPTSRPGIVQYVPPPLSTNGSGRPPPNTSTSVSSTSSLASATPPLPNFTKMTFISSGTPKALTSAVSTHNTSAPSVCVSFPPMPVDSMQSPQPVSMVQHNNMNSGAQSGNVETKSDEERKNDLIQEKLFKMNKSFDKHSPNRNKSSSKNNNNSNSATNNNNHHSNNGNECNSPSSTSEPLYMMLREKRMMNNWNSKVNIMLEHLPHSTNKESGGGNGSSITAPLPVQTRRVGRPKKNSSSRVKQLQQQSESKRRRRDVQEEEEEEDEDDDEEEDDDEDNRAHEEWKNKSLSKSSSSTIESTGICGNTRSSRKKKSRKIFDPADHETPSRKRKIVSNSPTPSADEEFPKEDICLCCEGGSSKNKKGNPEPLLKCKDCSNIVHPSCLEYTDVLSKKILEAPTWQCINCKVCAICESNKEDIVLIFCDGCDLGYHRDCTNPKIPNKVSGSWECSHCRKIRPTLTTIKSNSQTSSTPAEGMNGHDLPMEPLAEIKRNESSATSSSSMDNNGIPVKTTSRFVPILPPHFHPHTGNLPENWEDYLPDPEIPDVSYWDPKQVEDHFIRMGFSPEQAHVFLDQEIDGKSLLLLQRSDVTSSLGLKLGPALKLFNHIKKLQTRRHFPG
uniref:Atherinlike [Aplysia californica] n=1 Tax=Lepeophtheirus salmonis TaxID=72036 RepID=A0A0K2V691_LEPSM